MHKCNFFPSCNRRFFGPTNRVVTLKLIRYSLIMLLAPLVNNISLEKVLLSKLKHFLLSVLRELFIFYSMSSSNKTKQCQVGNFGAYIICNCPLHYKYYYFICLGWCGIAAVIAANVVIASYVHMAWNEDKDEKKTPQSNHELNAKIQAV